MDSQLPVLSYGMCSYSQCDYFRGLNHVQVQLLVSGLKTTSFWWSFGLPKAVVFHERGISKEGLDQQHSKNEIIMKEPADLI